MRSLKDFLRTIQLPQADWISLRQVRELRTERAARDEKPEENSVQSSSGMMIEVMAQGQLGYAAFPIGKQPHLGDLQSAAIRAFHQAISSAPYSLSPFKKGSRDAFQKASQGGYRSPYQIPFESRTPAEVNELLIQICRKLKVSPKIVRTIAALTTVKTQVDYVSTSGAEWTQNFTWTSSHSQATAQEGSLVQTRSDLGHFARSFQSGLESFETPDLWDRIVQIGEQAVELLSAEECPSQTASLLLMPTQMILQIHESIGHPLELDRILGDERNYAGWSFVKKEDFGKLQYGSPLLNISFDPTVPGEFASYAFDDSGAPANRALIIESGLLRRGLGSIESQLRSGLPGVANSRACSWNRPPIDRMANLNLEPGNSSFQEMIESIEFGVLMDTNRSWSIDDFRNKFQFGCEYGKLIENGRITRTVKNPNYRGQTVPFWHNLKAVGNREDFTVLGVPNCGKGEPNQVMRVGHASPPCLFEQIEIFGGGQ